MAKTPLGALCVYQSIILTMRYQGAIYKRIIDAVVEASKTDFEENGVANDVLLALQEVRQIRSVACFVLDNILDPNHDILKAKRNPAIHQEAYDLIIEPFVYRGCWSSVLGVSLWPSTRAAGGWRQGGRQRLQLRGGCAAFWINSYTRQFVWAGLPNLFWRYTLSG